MRNKKGLFLAILVADEICRFLAPFLIFYNPLFAVFVNIFFDFIDYPLFYFSGFKWEIAHRFDKLMDYWWYLFILIYSLTSGFYFKEIIILLFVIRSVGQIATIVTKNERLLIFFPNLMEWFFLANLLFDYLGFKMTLDTRLFVTLVISLIIGLSLEWTIHIGKPYARFYKSLIGIKV